MAGYYQTPAPRLLSHADYLERDYSLDSWVSQIQKVHDRWKKSRTLTELLHKFFNSVENPYYAALYLMAFSGDIKLAKPNTLAFTAMEEFRGWLTANQTDPHHYLSPQLKRKAFIHVTGQKYIALVNLVFQVYKMADNNEDFVADIEEMLNKKIYKEASQIIVMLGLQDHFSVEDFLIPLVFQDVINIVEDYLDATPNTRTVLIEYLDSLMVPGNTVVERDNIIAKLEIPDVKYQKLHYKPLSKFMVRIMKKYNIPASCCPNLTDKKNKGALQFIITKKYRDNNIGGDSWREMIMETVGTNKELQIELLHSLCTVNDLKEAMHWAQFYNIPFEELPDYLKRSIDEMNKKLMDGSDGHKQDEEAEEWNCDGIPDTQHFEFPLSTESIVMIDTVEKLERFIEYELTSDVKIVGLDAEWKPAFSHAVTVLSLLQIATMERVYLVDMLLLEKDSAVWHMFGSQLFSNQNILKLGFSIDSDIHMLRQTIKPFENLKITGHGFLDLSVLWNTLTKDWSIKLPFSVPVSSTKSTASLSHLVHLCCGYPLDKADQFSNWEKRPLRYSQKKYAAADAYCLLLVYQTLEECSLRQSIPFHDVCEEVMTKVTVKKTVNKKKNAKHQFQTEIQLPPKPNPEPVPVSWMYAMCTNNLEGLGKKLRMLGIDTLIAPSGRNYEEYLQMARSEKRIVLATGSLFNRFFNDLPPAFCYKVEKTILEEQIAEVLDYFNIAVKESDIFSRCMVCNFNEFARVESHTMKEMIVESSKQATAQPSHQIAAQPLDYVDDVYYDEDDEDDFHPGPPVHKMHIYETKPGEILKSGTFQTNKGVDVQLAEVPMGVIDRVPLFYICENCGKCYWDGSHLSRLLQSRSHKLISDSYLKSKLNFNK